MAKNRIKRATPADASLKHWLLSYIFGLTGGLVIGYVFSYIMAISFWDCYPNSFPRCLDPGHQDNVESWLLGIVGGFLGGLCGAVIRQYFIVFPWIFVQSILYGILGALSWPIVVIALFGATMETIGLGMITTRTNMPAELILLVSIGIILGAVWALSNFAIRRWLSSSLNDPDMDPQSEPN